MKIKEEVERILRVSDLMVTSHIIMSNKYKFRAIVAEVSLFTCSALLCAIVFADETLLIKYFTVDYKLYIGIFSLLTFIYSFLVSKFNWPVKSIEHKIAFKSFVGFKLRSKTMLKQIDDLSKEEVILFLNQYRLVTSELIPIPEKEFVKCKKHHKEKVYISKLLDTRPGTIIILSRIKLWWRDNCTK